MAVTKARKQQILKTHQQKDLDTGSSQVQIALLTERINVLSEHFKAHKKDVHGRRGLVNIVNKRRKLLDYLARKDQNQYATLIKQLDIRK